MQHHPQYHQMQTQHQQHLMHTIMNNPLGQHMNTMDGASAGSGNPILMGAGHTMSNAQVMNSAGGTNPMQQSNAAAAVAAATAPSTTHGCANQYDGWASPSNGIADSTTDEYNPIATGVGMVEQIRR
uniref:Uncharacterized protein n=1 Tax=Lygus hesperus TaxID=30085 RepID=A0A146LI96_LYGHE